MSKPRPIHTIHRDLQDTPDDAEPSFSYERQSFLATQEEDMEDEFHRRLTFQSPSSNNNNTNISSSNHNRDIMNNNNNNNSSHSATATTTRRMDNRRISNSSHHRRINNNSNHSSSGHSRTTTSATTAAAAAAITTNTNTAAGITSNSNLGESGGAGVGSFWRSRAAPNSPTLSRGSSKGSNSNNRREISPKMGKSKLQQQQNNNSSSGGGIGASLIVSPSAKSSSEDYYQQQQQQPPVDHIPIRRMSSSFSQPSDNNNNKTMYESKKKDVTKQRAEARRIKYSSQQMDPDGVALGHEDEKEYTLELEAEDHHVSGYVEFGEDHHDHHLNPSIIGEISMADNYRRNISVGTADTAGTGGISSQTSTSVASDMDSSSVMMQQQQQQMQFHGSKSGGGIAAVGGSTHNRSTSSSTIGGATASGGSNVLFGKSSSLIFPTGVEAQLDENDEARNLKRHRINLLLDACDSVRFPFKKKLILNSLNLTAADVPVKDLYNTSLGNSLHKLSLAGNRLSTIPPKLVTCLPVLKTLDLSQCELHQVPDRWNLPQLKRLNLSHNRLTDFPEDTMLEGLTELQELNMYGNKVSDIIVPQNPRLLSKLEVLNLGYNDLSYLPEDLDNIKSLRTLKVMHNLLEKIPMRVCDMDLKSIDVSSNPVIQPPIETCERGIGSMKRYYHCLRMEDKSKAKMQAAQQSRASSGRQAKKPSKNKIGFGIGSITKSIMSSGSSVRRSSDDMSATAKSQASSTVATGGDNTKRSKSLGVPALPTIVQTQRPGWERGSMPPATSAKVVRRSISLDQEAIATKKKSPSVSTKDEMNPSDRPSMEIQDEVTVNDTLKVIFVGMAMVGKTSMIKRLIEGEDAVIPKRDDRTVGVDIYEWDPKTDRRYEHIDTRIEIGDKDLQQQLGDVNVKFSVWDFAGQHVYHATHQLFFSNRALYVLVWDMGATNSATRQRKSDQETRKGAFSLSYDSDNESEEEDEGNFSTEEESRRADRALERDIDEKVQFWIDCIQSSAPGAAILPVASFDDYFDADGGQEAKRRCNILKQRLLKHEDRRIQGIKDRLKDLCDNNRAYDAGAQRLRKLLSSYTRPKLIFGNDEENSVVRVSGTKYTGFADLTQRLIDISTGRDKCNMPFPIFRGHVGARIPRMRLDVREAVRRLRDRFKVVEWGYFLNQLRESGLTNVEDISDALHFLANIGELSYFGSFLPDRESNGMEESGVSAA